MVSWQSKQNSKQTEQMQSGAVQIKPNQTKSNKLFQRDFLRALPNHICHHRQTPRTAARPSSLRSVPSGLPSTMANTQKDAAIHTVRSSTRDKSDDSRSTVIKPPTEYAWLRFSGGGDEVEVSGSSS